MMILGVVCFATILVSATILSSMISTTSHDVQGSGESLAIVDSSTTGHGAYWPADTTAVGSATQYYVGVDATPQAAAAHYELNMIVSSGGALSGSGTAIATSDWSVAGKIGATPLTFTYNSGTKTWTSGEIIPTGDVQHVEVWFTTGAYSFQASAVTLNFQAIVPIA
jgi:hypothetical protein